MFEREISPTSSDRISDSSESPDSVYKSSTDSSRTLSLSFSPVSTHTSTACKPPPLPLLKSLIGDDSDHEWDSALATPIQKRPPSVRKINRCRSRLSDTSRSKNWNSSPHSDQENIAPAPCSPLGTPPHKRMRALQIDDLSNVCHSPIRSKRFSPRTSLFSNNGSSRKAFRSPATQKKPASNPFTPNRTPKQKPKCRPCNADSGFSDDSWLLDIGKDHQETDMDDGNLALKEMSTSRYREEFCEECVVGSGEFGTVYKCVNKLDGCTYAIKKSIEPVAGSTYERVARNEVYAHAVLGKHSHVVRYYSAWAENGHLYIQNEFCNGGSLAEDIALHQRRGIHFPETELKDILKQVAHGLKYIHAQELAHLDIKPANIFIQYNPLLMQSPESGIEDDSSDCELNSKLTYKIGDFGHVASLNTEELEEGDCRFLPKELLGDDHSQLPKADIFALGLLIYQAATLTDLPKNGDSWHAIRDNILPTMKGYSMTLNSLVKKMVHPDPSVRPTAAILASHPELCPTALRSRKELARELNEERFKNQILAKQLKAVQEHAELKSFNRPSSRSTRLVGLKVNRSKSLTNF